MFVSLVCPPPWIHPSETFALSDIQWISRYICKYMCMTYIWSHLYNCPCLVTWRTPDKANQTKWNQIQLSEKLVVRKRGEKRSNKDILLPKINVRLFWNLSLGLPYIVTLPCLCPTLSLHIFFLYFPCIGTLGQVFLTPKIDSAKIQFLCVRYWL